MFPEHHNWKAFILINYKLTIGIPHHCSSSGWCCLMNSDGFGPHACKIICPILHLWNNFWSQNGTKNSLQHHFSHAAVKKESKNLIQSQKNAGLCHHVCRRIVCKNRRLPRLFLLAYWLMKFFSWTAIWLGFCNFSRSMTGIFKSHRTTSAYKDAFGITIVHNLLPLGSFAASVNMPQ